MCEFEDNIILLDNFYKQTPIYQTGQSYYRQSASSIERLIDALKCYKKTNNLDAYVYNQNTDTIRKIFHESIDPSHRGGIIQTMNAISTFSFSDPDKEKDRLLLPILKNILNILSHISNI